MKLIRGVACIFSELLLKLLTNYTATGFSSSSGIAHYAKRTSSIEYTSKSQSLEQKLKLDVNCNSGMRMASRVCMIGRAYKHGMARYFGTMKLRTRLQFSLEKMSSLDWLLKTTIDT